MHAIHISDQVLQRLDLLTRQTGKSRTYHVRRATDAYLENREDTRIATERLENTQKRMTLDKVECMIENAVAS